MTIAVSTAATFARTRRLRASEALRGLVRETRIDPACFIYPLFVVEGHGLREPIASMPGQFRLSADMLAAEAAELAGLGVRAVLLFGVPGRKDAEGSGAWLADGVTQRAVEALKMADPSLAVVADVCLCEYTDHGHCGPLNARGEVDNDDAVELLARTSVSLAEAGADMVAPSDMMDGRVGAIRGALDETGFEQLPIMAYSAKYASAFYGPFREAADSAPASATAAATRWTPERARGGDRHRGAGRHRHGEARPRLPRRGARGARLDRTAGGGVQRVGRVRDAQGRGRPRLDRRGARDDGDADGHPPRRRRHRHHAAREGGGALPTSSLIDVPLDPDPFDPGAIRAVAFDAYGTLFHWDFREVLKQALDDQGLAVDDLGEAARSFESAWNRVSPWATREDGKLDRDAMFAGPPPDFITTWEIWRRQFTGLFEDRSLDGDPTLGANLFREVLSRAPAYPDAHDVVEALHAAGYRLGLLSNADEDFLQSAVSHNRLRFSVIQSSESLRVYKPNRAAFEELCHRLGCAPDEVLYVGDSAQADVAGARHAGLRVAWLRERAGHELPEGYPRPDLAVASLTEAAGALGVSVPASAAT